MTTIETPRDAEGRRLCEHCQKRQVPESLGTKPRRYCSRNCRQRAYEARKTREAIVASVAVAVARDRRTSRDLPGDAPATTRDVAKPQAAPEIPAARPDGDFLLAPPAQAVPVRRPLSRRRAGIQAEAMPLLPFDAEGE